MGFSLVAEVMMTEMKKRPLIGHNNMYDILYFYNQFMGRLPATYMDFIKVWNKYFPMTYDSKVISYNNGDQCGTNFVLGTVFEFVDNDPYFSQILNFRFDTKNNMVKYQIVKENDYELL